MDKDIIESKRVGGIVRAVGKQCYYNSFRVVLDIPEYSKADYVEGIVSSGGVLIEHGWIEKDEVIVDPTLPLNEMVYFPGLRFAGIAGIAKALRIPKPFRTCEEFPIFYRFGWGGGDSPEMRSAWAGAFRFIGSEDSARHFEESKQCQGKAENLLATAT